MLDLAAWRRVQFSLEAKVPATLAAPDALPEHGRGQGCPLGRIGALLSFFLLQEKSPRREKDGINAGCLSCLNRSCVSRISSNLPMASSRLLMAYSVYRLSFSLNVKAPSTVGRIASQHAVHCGPQSKRAFPYQVGQGGESGH